MQSNKHRAHKPKPWKLAWLLCALHLLPLYTFAQSNTTLQLQSDTLKVAINDSAQGDTIKVSIIDIPQSNSALPAEVTYSAIDSVVFDLDAKKAFLYNGTQLNYQDIELKSNFSTIDYGSTQLFASGTPDSTGKIQGQPQFKQGDQTFSSETVAYNFRSGRGRSTLFTTKQEDGYISGQRIKYIKQDTAQVAYVRNATYTTCDLPPGHEHYVIRTSKLKIIPKDKIITGPAFIEIQKVPVPLVLPFGFFPAGTRKSVGIVPPTISQDNTKGFGFRGLGFYYHTSDYYDLIALTDIYTNGSYTLTGRSNYTKRYRFNGALELSYNKQILGPRETPEYNVSNDYSLTWRHAQDPKARPNSNFGAEVNIRSQDYLRNTRAGYNDLTTNSFGSSIHYNLSFPRTPFNLQAAARHSQNTTNGRVDVTLPDLNFTMNRIYPFRPRTFLKPHWYHDISLGYTNSAQAQYAAGDTVFVQNLDIRNVRTGMQQSAQMNTKFSVLKYFSLTPSINVQNNIGLQQSQIFLNPDLDRNDTAQVFTPFAFTTARADLALTTRVYGMVRFPGGPLSAVRHVVTPTITANLAPDPRKYNPGAFGNFTDTNGAIQTYNPYLGSIYGRTSSEPLAGLSFNLQNNIEAKVRNRKDTANPTKKVKLFDRLDLSTSYNFLRDSFLLDPIRLGASTQLFNKLTLAFSGTLDPYIYSTIGRRRLPGYAFQNGGIGSITNASLAMSTGFSSKGFAPGTARVNTARTSNTAATPPDPRYDLYFPGRYADFDVPWETNFNYNLNYSYGARADSVSLTQILDLSGSLSLTPKWRIGLRTSYNITSREIATTAVDITRDLHCWEMSFNWVPLGPYRNYTFTLNVKASSLRDLKVNKRKPQYVN